MGVDCKYISQFVHFGGSQNIESYLQECGRAGRNSELSTCYLLNNGILMKHCDEDMKNYVFSKSCRRKGIKSIFPHTKDADCSAKGCRCCDTCAMNCSCGDCDFPVNKEKLCDKEKCN